MDALAERVTRLERKNRRLRAGLLVLLLLGGATVTLGLAPPPDPALEEVRARRFVVVDEDGRVRAKLERGCLVLYGEKGQQLATFETWGEGASLEIGSGTGRARLEGDEDGGALKIGRTVFLGAAGDEGPSLRLGPDRFGPRIDLGLTGEVEAHLRLVDGKERVRLLAGWSALLDEAALRVKDAGGRPVFRAP